MEKRRVDERHRRHLVAVASPRASGCGHRLAPLKTEQLSPSGRRRMPIRDLMTRGIEVVSPEDSVRTAAQKMADRDVGFVPVCDGDRLVGVITDRDITIRAVASGCDPN